MKTLINLVMATIMLASLSACVAVPPSPYGNAYYGNAYYGNPYYAGSYRSYHHHGVWGHRW